MDNATPSRKEKWVSEGSFCTQLVEVMGELQEPGQVLHSIVDLWAYALAREL